MYRIKQLPFQIGDCNFANYSLKEDGRLRIINSQRFFDMPGFSKGLIDNEGPDMSVAGFTPGGVYSPISGPKVTPINA